MIVKTFMRMLLGMCLLALGQGAAVNEEDWELVYPETPFTVEDIFLMDVASRTKKPGPLSTCSLTNAGSSRSMNSSSGCSLPHSARSTSTKTGPLGSGAWMTATGTWLEQDDWPPRAWDYEYQEWEELRP